MIRTVTTNPKVLSHKQAVNQELYWLRDRKGYHIAEVRRIKNSWWGFLGDEDVTQIVYHKKESD